MATQCLHFAAYMQMPAPPASPPQILCVNPHWQAVGAAGDECPAYVAATPVRMARGFKEAMNRLSVSSAADARAELLEMYSRGSYYNRLNGRLPLTLSEQARIGQVLRRHGATDPVEFDHYEETFDFGTH